MFVLLTSAVGTAFAYSQTSVTGGGLDAASTAVNQDATAGEAVYAANCASCHQAGGTGTPGTFPPLAGNPNAADTAYVEKVVREGLSGPIEVNGETYDSQMPAISGLSDTEVADVSAYVAELATGDGGDTPEAAPPPVEGGAVGTGEALFAGTDRLANGAGACVGCHAAGSVGHLGGPGLGPDLTDVASRLGGEAGLSAWLANPPSPTMMPIFTERALTPEEIADITAFLVDAPAQSAPSTSFDWMFLAATVGLAVLLGAMAVAFRGTGQTYRERLLTSGRNGPGRRAAPGRRTTAEIGSPR